MNDIITCAEKLPKHPDLRVDFSQTTEFLKLIYPYFEEDGKGYRESVARVMAYNRITGKAKSHTLVRLNTTSLTNLEKFIIEHANNRSCVYTSLYTFINHTTDGVLIHKISNESASYTTALTADFDDIEESDYFRIKKQFQQADIETLDVFTGHGYQMTVLLKERCYDKLLLDRWIKLLITRGFSCDSAIGAATQLIRLPYTYNCKAFDKNSKHYNDNPQPVYTYVVNWTSRKYTSAEIIDSISKLPIMQNPVDICPEQESDCAISNLYTHEISDGAILKEDLDNSIAKLYTNLPNAANLPIPIKRMLYQTPFGMRNSVLLFLFVYLRNTLRLLPSDITGILKIWATRCSPVYKMDAEKEVSRLMSYGNDKKYGKYTPEMAKEFGIINFPKLNDVMTLPKSLVKDAEMPCNAVYLFATIVSCIKGIGRNCISIIDMIQNSGMSRSAIDRALPKLVKKGLICKNKGWKSKERHYLYYPNPYTSRFVDYIVIDRKLYEYLLESLSPSELKLYLLLRSTVNSYGVSRYSQASIGEMLGLKHNTISTTITKLAEKKIVRKRYVKYCNTLHCIYEFPSMNDLGLLDLER